MNQKDKIFVVLRVNGDGFGQCVVSPENWDGHLGQDGLLVVDTTPEYGRGLAISADTLEQAIARVSALLLREFWAVRYLRESKIAHMLISKQSQEIVQSADNFVFEMMLSVQELNIL